MPFTKVVLVNVWAGMVLAPDAVNPVVPTVAVANQSKVVPAMFAVNATAVVVPPEQIVCDRGVLVTDDRGFTVTV